MKRSLLAISALFLIVTSQDLLAKRPTDAGFTHFGNNYSYADDGAATNTRSTADGKFVIYWPTGGGNTHTPSLTDTSPTNGIPDVIERIEAALAVSYTQFVTTDGYDDIRDDSGDTDNAAPDAGNLDAKCDVYLCNTNAQTGYDGFYKTAPGTMSGDGKHVAGFILLDVAAPDYIVRHEFFHVVQGQHAKKGQPWLDEATSTYIQVFQGGNTTPYTHSALLDYWLAHPELGLDDSSSTHEYGAFLFIETLKNRYGYTFIKELYDRINTDDNTDSLIPLTNLLAGKGTTLKDVFIDHLGKTYTKQSFSYTSFDNITWSQSWAGASLTKTETIARDNMAWGAYKITPGAIDTIGITVDCPAGITSAVRVVTKSSTTWSHYDVTLDGANDGRMTINSSSGFSEIVVLFANITTDQDGQNYTITVDPNAVGTTGTTARGTEAVPAVGGGGGGGGGGAVAATTTSSGGGGSSSSGGGGGCFIGSLK